MPPVLYSMRKHGAYVLSYKLLSGVPDLTRPTARRLQRALTLKFFLTGSFRNSCETEAVVNLSGIYRFCNYEHGAMKIQNVGRIIADKTLKNCYLFVI